MSDELTYSISFSQARDMHQSIFYELNNNPNISEMRRRHLEFTMRELEMFISCGLDVEKTNSQHIENNNKGE